MMAKNNGLTLLPKKREAFAAIKRFMCDGDVQLKVEEENILNRWIYCDALLKAKEDDEDAIINKIADKFTVSTFTARNDIAFTQRLFAAARKINKKYLIHHHLERLDQDIERMRKYFFTTTVDEDGKVITNMPDAKELAAYAKLNETYTYTLNSVPEEVTTEKQPPPIFQFVLAPGQIIERPMLIDDALKQADAILLKKNKNGVYSADEEADEE
jgi:hypothetical protein